LRKIVIDVVLCAAMARPDFAAAASSTVGQAVQRLHLSPQQLLSLRDVLGGVERGAQVEASGEGLFILRDPASMAYAGEFSFGVGEDGTLTLNRVGGPATLDASQSVLLPTRLNQKSRAQIAAALAGSQILAAEPDVTDRQAPASEEERIAALKFIDARAAGPIIETSAVFFRDGSGVVRTVRATQATSSSVTPGPFRISSRYFSAVKSDGTHAWRDNVVETDSDVTMSLSDLEAHGACPLNGPCSGRRPVATVSGFHLIRWQHQLIAAVPPSLLAQLAPAPETVAPAAMPVPSDVPAAPPASAPAPEAVPPDSPAGNSSGH
jgi:hypothetical protein